MMTTAAGTVSAAAMLASRCLSLSTFQALTCNPLDRLSLIRKFPEHMESLLLSQQSRFTLLSRHQPLTTASNFTDGTRRIVWLTKLDLTAIGINITGEDVHLTENVPLLLGALMNQENTFNAEVTVPIAVKEVESLDKSIPCFAINVLNKHRSAVIDYLKQINIESDWGELRLLLTHLSVAEASILAQACAIGQWHSSNLHCGRCGSQTRSTEGGVRRTCILPKPKDRNLDDEAKPTSCGRTIYPRTDPVSITIVVSHDGQRILLGRKKEFPPGVYTALAGFVEHGESIEEGARREVFEESGVICGHVKYFATQPWYDSQHV